jgi:regulator of protease activity HflC (stomatin/prohibitin superfamily)
MNISQLVQFVAGIAWFGFIAAIGVVVVRVSRNQSARGFVALVLGLLILAIALSTVGMGLVFLQADQYAIVVSALADKGYREDPIGPGLHWIVPVAENVRIYSIAKQTYTMSSTTGEGQVAGDDSVQARTKDGQQVYIDASVTYQIDPTKIVNLNITWQARYEENLVRPQSRGIIRDVVSQYGVEEIVSSKRTELEQSITKALTKIFAENDLTLENFIVRNIRFSDEYAQAVEQKQIAEQQAQQARFVVEQRRQEAEQARQVAQGQADAVVIAAKGAAEARIIQAEAEAKALSLIAAALKDNPDLLMYQYITKLAPNVRVMFLPSGTPFILPTESLVENIPQ